MIGAISGVPFGPIALIATADWIRDRLNAFNVPFPGERRKLQTSSLRMESAASSR